VVALIIPISKSETIPMDSNAIFDSLPHPAPERRRLPLLLRRAWYGLNQTFRRRIAHSGVTPDQFTVLRTLHESDPKGITQRELGVLMTSDPNTIASLLERMETARWLERKPHEQDRRAHRICLLPSGVDKFLEVRQIALELQSEVLSVLPENKKEEFLEQLAEVAEACRNSSVKERARPSNGAKRE
jgi:DNA-binding MarR family transcriptional regulator